MNNYTSILNNKNRFVSLSQSEIDRLTSINKTWAKRPVPGQRCLRRLGVFEFTC